MRSIAKFQGKANPSACQSAFATSLIPIICCTISYERFGSNMCGSEEKSDARKSQKRRAGLEKAAHTKSILRHAPKRDRAALHRGLRRYGNGRDLQVCLLRPAIVSLGNEISFRLRLAQFLRSCKRRSRCRGIRLEPWDAAPRSKMQPLRCSPRTRV